MAIERLKEWLKAHILGGIIGGLLGFGLRWLIISNITIEPSNDAVLIIIALIITGAGFWYGLGTNE